MKYMTSSKLIIMRIELLLLENEKLNEYLSRLDKNGTESKSRKLNRGKIYEKR